MPDSPNYFQRCAARYAAIKASPESRQRRRRANLQMAAILFVGFPAALFVVGLGEWFHWPRVGYFPIAAGMVGVGKLLGTYVALRVERNTNSG